PRTRTAPSRPGPQPARPSWRCRDGRSRPRWALRRDGDLAAGVVPQHVGDGFCRLVERVGLGDDDLDLARLEELAERGQVLAVHRRGHQLDAGGAESHQDSPRHPGQAREHAAGIAEAVRDERSAWRQHPRGGLGRVVEHVVEDDIETLAAPGEVFSRVVDDMVGPERPDQLDAARPAHGGDLGAQHPGQLHRMVPTPPEAPLIRTRVPALTRATSRIATRAVSPHITDAAASANESPAGLLTSWAAGAAAYCAKAPARARAQPNTSSPG